MNEVAIETITVEDMVINFLKRYGFDGLYNDVGCGCDLNNFMPCREASQFCEAAFKFDCSRCLHDGECDMNTEGFNFIMSVNPDFCTPSYKQEENDG